MCELEITSPLRFEQVQQAVRVLLDALDALDPLVQGLDLLGDFDPVQTVLGQGLQVRLARDAVADLAALLIQNSDQGFCLLYLLA